MIKRVLSLMLALLLILCAVPVLAESITVTTMYVYSDNGKGLNVRSTPYVGNNIIGLAPFGSEIKVREFMENGWACIEWPATGIAYVQSRFLQWDKPASRYIRPTQVITAAPTAAPTVAPYSYYNGYSNYNYYNSYNNYADTYTDTLATLNAEFRTARAVTPFSVVVRPSRASGWVNLRWAPSKDTEVITTYRSGVRLTVLAETQSWYQVNNPDTNTTGFIMKAYTTRQY